MTAWTGSCLTPTTRWGITRAGSGPGGGAGTATATRAGQRPSDADGGPVRPPGQGVGRRSGVPVIFCKAGERKHHIAEEYLAGACRRHRGVLGPGGPGPGPGVEGEAVASQRGHHEPGEEDRIRQPLLVPHHGPGLGTRDDQDVRPSAVRRAGHPQRPRVRRVPAASAAGIGFTRRATALPGSPTRGPGPDRRHLVAGCGYRAAGPGLRPLDLYRLPVLRAGPGRAGPVSGFRYGYSVYQVEYSRNLIFASGAQMDRVFDTVVDRTRSRLDVPELRTLFGPKQRPARHRASRSLEAGSRDRDT